MRRSLDSVPFGCKIRAEITIDDRFVWTREATVARDKSTPIASTARSTVRAIGAGLIDRLLAHLKNKIGALVAPDEAGG